MIFLFKLFFNVCAKSLDLVEGENVNYIKSHSGAMFTRETQKKGVLSFWLLGGEGKTGRTQAPGHHGQFRGTLP